MQKTNKTRYKLKTRLDSSLKPIDLINTNAVRLSVTAADAEMSVTCPPLYGRRTRCNRFQALKILCMSHQYFVYNLVERFTFAFYI